MAQEWKEARARGRGSRGVSARGAAGIPRSAGHGHGGRRLAILKGTRSTQRTGAAVIEDGLFFGYCSAGFTSICSFHPQETLWHGSAGSHSPYEHILRLGLQSLCPSCPHSPDCFSSSSSASYPVLLTGPCWVIFTGSPLRVYLVLSLCLLAIAFYFCGPSPWAGVASFLSSF